MEITSQLLFIQHVSLEHSTVSGNETAPCILGNLVGGVGVIQNDLRETLSALPHTRKSRLFLI